jgi:multidrug efflux pump
VRGFITTPLERAIAAADGIEYLESVSKLGLSTITARLSSTTTPPRRSLKSAPKLTRSAATCRPKRKCPS